VSGKSRRTSKVRTRRQTAFSECALECARKWISATSGPPSIAAVPHPARGPNGDLCMAIPGSAGFQIDSTNDDPTPDVQGWAGVPGILTEPGPIAFAGVTTFPNIDYALKNRTGRRVRLCYH